MSSFDAILRLMTLPNEFAISFVKIVSFEAKRSDVKWWMVIIRFIKPPLLVAIEEKSFMMMRTVEAKAIFHGICGNRHSARWQGGLEEAEAMLARRHACSMSLYSNYAHLEIIFYCFFEIYFWHTSEISHLAVNAAVGVMGKHATGRRSNCDSRKTWLRFLLSRKSCRSHCLRSISISFNQRVDLSYQVDFLLFMRERSDDCQRHFDRVVSGA